MKIVKTVIALFKKVNDFKEIFKVISVVGEILDFANQKFTELEQELD